ncbi:MAG: stage II sporulation protein P [Blautia sp.]
MEANETYLSGKVLDETQEQVQEKAKKEQQKQKKKEQQEKEKAEKEQSAETAVTPHPVLDLSPERLADYDYLLNNFFIVDPNTATSADQLNAAQFLAEDLTMKQDNSKPQILVYHSHSQEDFADTVPGDSSTTVVGVGDYLVDILQNQYGYQVLHVTDAFDIVDGELDRNKAYDFARAKVEQVLEENPSIEVVIDLHRDGVPEDRHLVTEVNGKPTAQIMCYNGLSYTVNNGPVDYLPNPYIQDNLAFSFQLEYQAAQYYPDLYRGIYLAGLRYNLHLRPKAILLEAGAQTNTVEEVKNAMEPFADILDRVLKGEG